MAKTVINAYSVELSQGPPGNSQTYAPIRPNQFMGRMRISTFTYTFATETATSNALCIIPQGARILDIIYAPSASMGSANISFGAAGADGNGNIDDGSVNGIIGPDSSGSVVADNVALFAAAATNTTAHTKVSLNTGDNAGGWLYQAAKAIYLTITLSTAASTTQKISGWVVWVDD